MKVLHVTEAFSGGLAVVLCNLLPELERADVEVTLLCDVRGSMPMEDVLLRGRLSASDAKLKGIHLKSIRTLRSLASAVDVVHLHGARAGAVGRIFLKRTTVKVYSPHGGSFHRSHGHWLRKGGRLIERTLARRTDAVVVSSLSEASSVTQTLKSAASRQRLHVIRHGIMIDSIPRRASEIPQVAVVSRLVAEKSVDRAIAGFALLRADRPASLVVFGDGPERARLVRTVRRLGLEEDVHFAGFVPVDASVLSGFDVLLNASLFESFGLTLVEGLAAGCSIVTTRVGIAPEILHPPEGFLVERTEESIAAGLRMALLARSSPYFDPRPAALAAQAYLGTWEEVAEDYLLLYEECLLRK